MQRQTAWRRFLLVPVMAGQLTAQQQPPPQSPMIERVGDTGFIQLQADSFRHLDARHQALAYWLTQASIAMGLWDWARHGTPAGWEAPEGTR